MAIRGIGALAVSGGGGVNLTTTTTVGTVSHLGAAGTGAGETTAEVFALDGTTGNSIILANQQGTAPTGLIFTSSISADQTGAKSLVLGGNTGLNGGTVVINEITGLINNWTGTTPTATGLIKIGSNTWLYSPNPSNYVSTAFTQSTATTATLTAGAGVVNSNVIFMASTTGIVLGETVTGTNVPVAVVTAINPGVSITISRNIATAVPTGTLLTFNAATGFTGNVTVTGGTMQFLPTPARATDRI